MKKNLTKKLVLKKHTVANLNGEQLKALRGGNMDERSVDCCSDDCADTGGNGEGGLGWTKFPICSPGTSPLWTLIPILCI